MPSSRRSTKAMALAMDDISDRREGGRNAAETEGEQPDGAITDQASPTGLQAELADTKDRLLRAVADQQNIRRQMQRQRDEAVKFAASQLASELVDTLDNLRRAIESAPPAPTRHETINPILKGVEVTEANLLAILARHGIQRIDPIGAVFDPHLHQAIFRRADAIAPDGTVIEVLQPGYMLHDRVLRPAMVGVAVKKQNSGAVAE
jgi:molecular chaperone GrpE